MANVKISELPAATLPLTGSELVPIVQSGTTDQVTVTNLTAGRTLNVAAVTATGTVSGATVTASGTVSGATVTASGTVSGATVTASGTVSGATVTASGTVSGATVTASGTVSGATAVVGAGTAAAPSISSTGDSNTGIFFPAADTIAFAEGGTEVLRLNSNGNAIFTGTAVMASSFLRNRIINGAMAIDQRNAGASFSSGVGAVTYGLDRFYVFSSGAAVTGQRVNPSLTGFPNALRVTGAAGATYTEVGQRIESANIADLAGSTVTVSFWAAASVATSVNVYASYANTQDNFSASTGIGSTAVAITSTLAQYTVSFALPSQAANGIVVGFTFGSGLSSGTFTLTGVQLEVGTAATPFERRQFGQELALCQRYYQHFGNTSGQPNIAVGWAKSGSTADVQLSYLVTMRAAPTLTTSSTASDYAVNTQNTGVVCSAVPNLNTATPYTIRLGLTVSSGLTAGNGIGLYLNTTSSFIGLSAEL